MIEKTKLKITTLTSTIIGSGAELSPYSDYIVDGNKIGFIDKHKSQTAIAANDRWLDEYVQGVAMGYDNNRSEFDLKSFLINNKVVHKIDDIIASRCDTVISNNNKLSIKSVIKSPLQEPYFPGSSIKGALKTVLMYNWLKTNKDQANKLIEDVINGGNFNRLEKKFEYRENAGSSQIYPNVIRQVTDSGRLNRDSIIVVDCERKMPLRLECIRKNLSTEFELVLENYHWADVAEQANDYAFDCIDRELDLIERNEKLRNYFNCSVDIQDLVNEEIAKSDTDTAYFRIGFGKGYYLNSLGIAIYDYVQDKEYLYNKFEEFLKKQFTKKSKENDFSLEEFPRTRLMVKKTQEPLGWIKIERI